jgi:hypothetical protein
MPPSTERSCPAIQRQTCLFLAGVPSQVQTRSKSVPTCGRHRLASHEDCSPTNNPHLLDLGLVEWRGRHVFAKEPSLDQFVYSVDPRRQNEPWHKRLAYFCLLCLSTSCRLTLKQVVVLCLLFSPNMRDGVHVVPRQKHLAALLRISEKTVRTALKKLEEVGCFKDGQLLPPTPEMLSW